jgi:hypothetical protein
MPNRKYLTLNSIVVAAGILIVVTSFAFDQATATWIAFGLSIIALAASIASLAVAPSAKASLSRAVAALVGVIAAFTIIASVGVFTGGAQHWIEFGAGVAATGLASLALARYVLRLVESSDSTDVKRPSGMPQALHAAA